MTQLERRRAERSRRLRAATQPRPADVLHDLAYRVCRLCPDHRDPERFHVEKSEIVSNLRRLAAEVT